MGDAPHRRDGPAPPPVRMDELAVLPVFFKLAGKRVVMAGGAAPAVWKTELLSAAGARVVVFSADPCAELIELAGQPPSGPIHLVRRAWEAADLDGAALAIGAIEDEDEAGAFRDAARRAGVPVNVVDKPGFCDFQFGTIVNRSPLVVGISTDGAAPVFGQGVRTLVEAVLPQGLRRWAAAARNWRAQVQGLGLDFQGRRRFWEAFADRALTEPDRMPSAGDLAAFQAQALEPPPAAADVLVTLVGAGPGSPDEVTLRAVRALQSADIVLYPEDIDPAIVNLSRREAARVAVSEAPGAATLPSWLAPLLRQAKRIAWLAGGSPDSCRRWSEREAALHAQGVRVAHVAGLGRCRSCGPGCPAWPGQDARADAGRAASPV